MDSTTAKAPRLMDLLRSRIRYLHYSYRTEQAYVYWAKRFIYFHNKKHPKEMGETEIAGFLNHLSTKENVAASTQNQAMNAIVFLYKKVLERELKHIPEFSYAKRPKKAAGCNDARRSGDVD
jgi:hypothetical protein